MQVPTGESAAKAKGGRRERTIGGTREKLDWKMLQVLTKTKRGEPNEKKEKTKHERRG